MIKTPLILLAEFFKYNIVTACSKEKNMVKVGFY